MGHDEKALMPIDDEEESKMNLSCSVYSSQRSASARHKPIEYLNKGHQQKETVRDFIDGSRKILMAQISINNKT